MSIGPPVFLTRPASSLGGATYGGSRSVRDLGALYFPCLAGDDLYVEPSQVFEFQQECAPLRANLKTFADGVDPLNPKGVSHALATDQLVKAADLHADFVERVSVRLANIEHAVRRAMAIGGGVVIW